MGLAIPRPQNRARTPAASRSASGTTDFLSMNEVVVEGVEAPYSPPPPSPPPSPPPPPPPTCAASRASLCLCLPIYIPHKPRLT